MNFEQAQSFVIQKLDNELAPNLYYHGVHHTLDVIQTAEYIAGRECITGEDLILVKTAALFHDAGYIEQYDDNEKISGIMAEKLLPGFGYNSSQIQKIIKMILATEIKREPQNILEKIVVDADFDYFGRDDFAEVAETLRREFYEYNYQYTLKQWDEVQVAFLKRHRYYTRTSIKNRVEKKKNNLSEIIERLSKYA